MYKGQVKGLNVLYTADTIILTYYKRGSPIASVTYSFEKDFENRLNCPNQGKLKTKDDPNGIFSGDMFKSWEMFRRVVYRSHEKHINNPTTFSTTFSDDRFSVRKTYHK
jgi:hypothetical protein